jgi:hypothetical protein
LIRCVARGALSFVLLCESKMDSSYSCSVLATISETSPCSLGCTDQLVMPSAAEYSVVPKTAPERQALLGNTEARINLRFLTLRVPIYERLVRDTTDHLAKLSLDSRASHHVTSEYRRDLEFLQTGLANALDQLAVEHGLFCDSDVVQVCAPQVRRASPEVDATASVVRPT